MRDKQGFTTIELLIVIAVIAVLAAGIIAAVQRARIQAQDGEIKKKLSELESAQTTIKSEGGGYKAYDTESGSLEDSRLQEISDAVKQINGVGFDEDDLIGANNTGYGVVTPTVTGNGVFCFSSREQGVRRLSNGYDDGLDYAQALKNPGSGPAWDCPSVSFTPDANPENITASNLETSYARLTEAKESQVYDPQNYNKEIKIKLTSSEGGEICKAETGTACTSGWTNSIEVSPDPVADNFKLRNPTVNSPGKTKHDLEITEISGNGSTDTKWILKSNYASCKKIKNVRGHTQTDDQYAIKPSGVSDAFQVKCNMSKDGGGWTRIKPSMARTIFNAEPEWFSSNPGTEKGFLDADNYGFDSQTDKAYFQDYGTGGVWNESPDGDKDGHTGFYDIDLGFEFQEFYLKDYEVMSWAGNGPPRDSASDGNGCSTDDTDGIDDIDDTSEFANFNWMNGHPWGVGNEDHGDIAFGTPADTGPAMSLRNQGVSTPNPAEGALFQGDKVTTGEGVPDSSQQFSVNTSDSTFRIGAHEQGCQKEGWVPWNEGYIYVR